MSRKFWNIFGKKKFLRIIADDFEEYFLKFWELYRKSFQKISEDFEKYFGNFRDIFQKIL